MAKWTLPVGDAAWTVQVQDESTIALSIAATSTVAPREMVKAALETPLNFEPLRRALTPDDHVCIAIDERLPQVAELIAGILDHLVTAGIDPDAVTLLSPDPKSQQTWIDDLPDEFADVRTEVHHPADRKKLAYLASTKAEERIYMTRTLVEADFVIALAAHRHDDQPGEVLLIPNLCDVEYQKQAAATPPDNAESMWLLGTPFFVRVIEGAAGGVQDVITGFADSHKEADRRRDARWSRTINTQPETVVLTVDSQRFEDVAASIANAERVLAPKGRIVVLLKNAMDLPPAMDAIRATNDATAPLKILKKTQTEGWQAATQWAETAAQAAIFLAGPISQEQAEEIFATAIADESELQRLIDGGGRVLVLPDAHLQRIEYQKASGAA